MNGLWMTGDEFLKQMEWVYKNNKKLYVAEGTDGGCYKLSSLKIFASNIEGATEYAKKYFEPEQTLLSIKEIK